MKKIILSAIFIIVSCFANAQVIQLNAETIGITDLETGNDVAAGFEWGRIDGAITVSNAFDTKHMPFNCSSNNFDKVIIDGYEISAAGGVKGQDNPKDADGYNPAASLKEQTSGAVIKITAEKDGWVYIVAKLFTNKQYVVFENGAAIGYKIAMENTDERVEGGVLNLEVKGSGEYNYVTLEDYPAGLGWVIREYLGDAEAATAGNGLGVLCFPVYSDCEYLVSACGSRISWSGVYFSEKEAAYITLAEEDGSLLTIFGNDDDVTEPFSFIFRSTATSKDAELIKAYAPVGDVIIPSTVSHDGVEYNVSGIGNKAFFECSELTSVTIPDGVTNIGASAFSNCSNLTTLRIGKGVKTIGESAFANCTNLSDVYCYAEEFPTTDYYYIFSETPINQAALYIPAIHQTKYQTTSPWSSFKYILLLEGATAERCAKPTISVKDGKITFECETPEASFVSNYVPLNGSTTEGNEMTLPNLYRITVFAQKYGYLDSPAATAEVEMSLGKYGDLSGDGKVDVEDHVKLSDIILNQSK